MREFAVFLRKCPKTFGQDCRLVQTEKSHVVRDRKQKKSIETVHQYCSFVVIFTMFNLFLLALNYWEMLLLFFFTPNKWRSGVLLAIHQYSS